MGQAGAVVIALIVDKDLGLVFQPAEGGGVQDPVPIALKRGPVIRLILRVYPPFGILAPAAIRSQALIFLGSPTDSVQKCIAYVPSSQEFRYFTCSAVSVSIATFIPASFRRAISRSISSGTL